MGIKRFLTGKMCKAVLYAEGSAEGDVALVSQSATDRNLRVALYSGGARAQVSSASDSWPGSNNNGLITTSRLHLYNDVAFDRQRNNVEATLLASAARTVTTSSADQTNYNAKGIIVVFDVTAVPGTDTVQLKVQAKDPASGKYIDMVTGTAESAVGTYVYAVYPGIGDKGTILDNYEELPLPRTWRVQVVHSAATSFTYSVGVMYVL